MKRKIAILLMFLLLVCTPLLSACNEEIKDHNIFVTSSDIRLGTVSGDGVYKTGKKVTLVANEKVENIFVAWVKNNTIVSKEKEFSFYASTSNEGKYTAVFESPTSNFLKLEKVEILSSFDSFDEENFYALSSLTLSLDEKTIIEKTELNEVLTDEYSIEYIIENDYVYQKTNQISGTVTTVVNQTPSVSNILFEISTDNQNQLEIVSNVNNLNLSIKLTFSLLTAQNEEPLI